MSVFIPISVTPERSTACAGSRKPGCSRPCRTQLIFSMAAGFDHVLQDQERPQHVPIVRIIDDTLSTMMSEFAVYAVLGFHRYMPAFHRDQQELKWQRRWPRFTADTHVGVLGLEAPLERRCAKARCLRVQSSRLEPDRKTSKGITCRTAKMVCSGCHTI